MTETGAATDRYGFMSDRDPKELEAEHLRERTEAALRLALRSRRADPRASLRPAREHKSFRDS